MNETNPYLERALLLYANNRYEQAITELRRALTEEPNSSYSHSMLANCLCELKRFPDALQEAGEAIRLAPEDSYAHRAYAFVLSRQGNPRQAEVAINEAIRIAPWDFEHFHFLSIVRMQQENWRGALEAADRGLKIQSDDVGLINVRGRALIKLGRAEEALQTVDTAIRFAPDNAYSHANKGWSLLEAKDNDAALAHFREALRLDPTLEWAREGMATALKARYPLYRLVLGYYFWMSRLPSRVRYGIIMGLWFLNNLLRDVSRGNPALRPFVLPLTVLYGLFCYVSWTIDPLFNTLLRFNPFGKYLLTPAQVVTSNLVAGSFVTAAASLSIWTARQTEGWLFLGFGMLFFSAICAGTTEWRARLPERIRPIVEIVGPVLVFVLLFIGAIDSGL
jgi:tetratricopeptide (TPR) repeat protein